ncbi:PREDICTED: probable LRR receptor-like serine/threonine-protein kinase RFK1 [Tarenaya hassleriana]|uniref:probable LRR receptor-like serine/threonine-protein kinase RFK1 n=1 Tax=Tarenaya hassleriana TaxID=28532 RepID=UPI00053C74BA|nr:PREDICTED: probable LRR receptor-like serine/threonine-protein kinase RFK1 [Tarenaya hassleriana]
MIAQKNFFVFLIFAITCFGFCRITALKLPKEEADALQQIVTTLGSKYWKFDADDCTIEMVGLTQVPPQEAEHEIICECSPTNGTDCHVVKISLKGHNLPGMLPREIDKLPNLRELDLAYNYLNGSIPREWASTKLTSISLLVNRLSGEIPKELGDVTTLTFLNLEANEISGTIPNELGNLFNLQTLMLSSNKLTGNLPISLSRLQNLTDLRINDNQFHGRIPGFLQNWKKLTRLEMVASGLDGPIPSVISVLNNLQDLRIGDINGPDQPFPVLRNATGLIRLVLRNCNIDGQIPPYVGTMKNLETLDLTFNKLVGEIPSFVQAERVRFIFLTGNMITGDVPDGLLRDGITIDLSYNNLTWQGPEHHSCQKNLNLNLNLFGSSSMKNPSTLLPCIKDFKCPHYSNCFHVNCGGNDVKVNENKKRYLYQGDGDVEGGVAKNYLKPDDYWGFSSTGDFMDDNNYQNTRFISFLPSSNLSELYTTARIAPVSLTYFHACLENGKYTVNLDFAEIKFTNDATYNSLGKRFFDIYIQGNLVWKDFNIVNEANGAQKPVMKSFPVNVTDHFLAIRLSWDGKGTTRIPTRGVYGPLISAISVVSDSKQCSHPGKSWVAYVVVGIGVPFLVVFILGILWWRGWLPRFFQRSKGPHGEGLPSGTFTLNQIKAATDYFDTNNKIGEGGFGPVYKGVLSDGRVVAVKQLSSKSKQGNREFLNEIGTISCLQHPNLVKLHGFCVEGDQLLLVYEYMENNSLARALFCPPHIQLKLDWPMRFRICCGIAKGLAFLHEESPLKFVHRDIKATNVLLDKDLNPKISDFGLAKLDEEEKTHISTRVAGTIGYMAPEYALWGYLTFKADVYSFGILALEIVAGKSNSSFVPTGDCVCLLDWAGHCLETGEWIRVVDERLRSEMNGEEAETVIKVALLCASASPTERPTMSEVVSMLENRAPVPATTPESSMSSGDLRFKALKDMRKYKESNSSTVSHTRNSNSVVESSSSSSACGHELLEIRQEPKS